MKYTYEKPKGFLWNITQKLEKIFNMKTGSIFISGTANEFILNFPRKLTKEEKKKLDTIMKDDPAKPEVDGTVFRIVDLWGMKEWFEEQVGKPFTFWFENYKDAPEECYMYLQFKEGLSEHEKKKVIDTYKSLIEEYKE